MSIKERVPCFQILGGQAAHQYGKQRFHLNGILGKGWENDCRLLQEQSLMKFSSDTDEEKRFIFC